MHATIGLVVKEALRTYPYIAFNVLSRCDNTRRRVSTWGVQNENMSPGSRITGLNAGGIVQCVVKLVSAPAESAQCWVTWVCEASWSSWQWREVRGSQLVLAPRGRAGHWTTQAARRHLCRSRDRARRCVWSAAGIHATLAARATPRHHCRSIHARAYIA